jgi:hypothetical protein
VEFTVAATLTTNDEEFGVVAADTHANHNEELVITDTLATFATINVKLTVTATFATKDEELGVVATYTLATYNKKFVTSDTPLRMKENLPQSLPMPIPRTTNH